MTAAEFAAALAKEKSAAFFCHVRPDGDTLGAALALSSLFRRMGAETAVFCDSPVPEKFFYLAGAADIGGAIDKPYSAFVAVDCADAARLGKLGVPFLACKRTYNVDHHVSNDRYAKTNLVLSSPATCLIALGIFRALGAVPTAAEANCLFTGLSTDTGHFMHSNANDPSLFRAAADLVEAGADAHDVAVRMFRDDTPERLALFARATGAIRYFADGKIAVESVTLKDLAETGAAADMTEGLIDRALAVRGVEIAVCLLQTREKTFKVSFRSRGTANVNALAGVFGGGGHTLASGCMINGVYEEVLDRVTVEAEKYLA